MERLKQKSFEINSFDTVKKTSKLIREFPDFRRKIQSVVSAISVENPEEQVVIADHYGVKYEEMGFCTKAFADMVAPGVDNTDIGICATEFYVFIDILDDLVDDKSGSFDQQVEYLRIGKAILKGEAIDNESLDVKAMVDVAGDMKRRVAELSPISCGLGNFIQHGLGTMDALYREIKKQSRIRNLVTLAYVGKGCSNPLMELINCKFGDSSLFRPVGNLVAIGNILDDYWDVLKDRRAGKETFLTMTLLERDVGDAEAFLRTLLNFRAHSLAISYSGRLFARAMMPLDKEWQEDALAIALFAQIGVLKRRYESLKLAL